MQNATIEGFRLSPQQAHLWQLQQADASGVYAAECVVTITGPLDEERLAAAVTAVVNRHEILRTTFHRLPAMDMPLQVVAAEGMSLQIGASNGHHAPDLTQGPLLSVTLERHSPQQHTLFIRLPALCADRVSLENLIREISLFYGANGADELSEDPMQYADLAEWQNDLLESAETAAGRAYWRQAALADLLAVKLPFEQPPSKRTERPPAAGLLESQATEGRAFTPQQLATPLCADLIAQIEETAQRYAVAPAVVLLACWHFLLWRLSNSNATAGESLVGVAYDGRKYEELKAALGLLAKHLPVHCVIETRTPGCDFLRQVHDAIQERAKWQEYFAWDQLLQHSNGSQPHATYFPCCFDYTELPAAYQAGAVRFTIQHQSICTDRFKVRLTGQRQDAALTLLFDYDAALFRHSDIERLAEQYLTLLHSFVDRPTAALGALNLVSAREREQLLVNLNKTATDYGPFQPVHKRFAWQVERTPDAPAVLAEDQALTYGELNRRANQLAHHLQRLGVGAESLVGLCAERSVELLVGLLGILKAGGAYVPLDPLLPTERLAAMLADAQPQVLLTQQQLLAHLPPTDAQLLCLDRDWPTIAQESAANPDSQVAPENLVYVLFTSGSTGRPKGVGVTHGNLANYVQAVAQRLALPAGASYATVSTVAADLGNTAIFPALCSGGCLHVVAQARLTDPAAFADYFQQHAIDCLKIVPSHLATLLQSEGARVLPRGSFGGRLVLGGEALRPALVDQVQRLAPELQVLNHYGPTETTVGVLTNPVATGTGGAVPLGRPLGNVQAYVLDEAMQPVPMWTAGELYIGGAQVTRGYLHRPDQTAERFVPDPFSATPGARLYRTGDLVRHLPEGAIAFLGRVDHQIKIRGFRIELGEIEAALRTLPTVQACVVDARDDGAGLRLVAYVVVDKTAKLTVSDLRRGLQTQLPDYMLPAAFVKLDALPLTANGKVDRRALPAPEKIRSGFAEAYVAPRTPLEETVAGIWAEVLGLAQVGLHDNFFELGGHSLMATQLIARVRESCRVELPLRRLFDTPTVAGLADYIDNLQGDAAAPLVTPIERASREEELPLSFAQQRLWFLDQLEPDSSSYNLSLSVQLQGQLDQDALERAFTELVRRHEILRTTFSTIAGKPQQVIAPAPTVSLASLDLRHLPKAERNTQAQQIATDERNRPFDLAHGPLFRVTLLRLADAEAILLLTLHHIISDGWSSGILVREVAALYTAFVQGEPSPLPDLPIQYADFARWQREWLQGEVLAQQLAYWKAQLGGELPVLQLSTDRPRPPVQRFQGARQRLALGRGLSDQLTTLAQQLGVTPFMLLLAAFNVLLHRYTGQTDIIVGSPIANRTRTEIESLIGFFVNTLALRTDLTGNPAFATLVQRVREVALAATAHQDVPFEKVVDEVQPERNLSRTPLFQVMFMLRNVPAQEVALPGVTLTPLQLEGETAKFDLSLYITESGAGWHATMEYNTDLFDGTTIERMLAHFQQLLTGVVADPTQPLLALPLLTAPEQAQIDRWNATGRAYPPHRCLHQLFEAQVARTPDLVAVVFADQQLTYRELNQRANQLAHYLQALGIGPDTRVGVCMERSIEMVVSLYGILKAGGAYVPLDPTYPRDRLTFMLEDAQVPALLTQQRLVADLPDHQANVLCLDRDWELIARESTANPQSAVTADNLAYVIFTSGSTGRPKGAMNTHRAICNHMQWLQEQYGLTTADRFLQKTPFSFDVSVCEFFWPLSTGARLVVARPEGHKDPNYLVALIREQAITTLHFVPSMLQLFVEAPDVESCHTIKQVICSGEALPYELQERLFARLAVELHNLYGPTEAAVHVTHWTCQKNSERPIVPIGHPVANTQMYILDRCLQPLPIGVPGELHIGGIQVSCGYLDRPELTSEKFIPDPFSSQLGARLYKTGDLTRYLPDGAIEYLGRIDHQVKIRGFRIELGEIEAAVSQHPAVREVVVVAREDQPGEKRLVAYLVPKGQTIPTINELRHFLLQTLPEYTVPALFVMLEEMPLLPNGKTNRKMLPTPDTARPELAEAFVPPRTPLEAKLAEIWATVLGLTQVGIHDNFFALGGDSILSIQIVARANAAGLRLAPKQLFQHQTIAGLAAVAGTTSLVQAEQGLVTGPVPLTPIQHWFFAQESPAPHHWNQAILLEVQPALQPTLLEQTVQQVLAHHDALRMHFNATPAGWQQVNHGMASAVPFSYIDLSRLSPSARRAALEAKAAELQASLDLAQGPLLQVALFHWGEQAPQRLLVIIHHLVVDGISWRILLEDLVTVYAQLGQGGPVQLPPKSTSFKQWAEHLMAYIHSAEGMGALKAELPYWLAAARTKRVALPVDFAAARDANTEASAQTVTVALSSSETTALLQAVPEVYHTQINDLLLTALVQSLAPWLGTDGLLLDLEGHGREEILADVDISRTVGWFTALYPVWLDLAGETHPGAALMSIKEQLRAIPNRGLGYGLLRYLLADDEIIEQLCRLPKAEVSFNYFGQLDQALPGSTLGATSFAPAYESAGPLRSAHGKRNYLLSITSNVSAGQLHVIWAYSENLYRRATIERLAATYIATLQALIAHCLSPEAGGFTPSDFPLAELDQDELALAFAEVEFE